MNKHFSYQKSSILKSIALHPPVMQGRWFFVPYDSSRQRKGKPLDMSISHVNLGQRLEI